MTLPGVAPIKVVHAGPKLVFKSLKFNLLFIKMKSYCLNWASQVALVVKNLCPSAGDIRDVGLTPGSGRSPGLMYGKPTAVFLPGKSHEQRSLVGYSP